MLKIVTGLFCAALFLASCEKSSVPADTFFDSLIDHHVAELSMERASLTKVAKIGYRQNSVTITPSRQDWENELAVFRQLAVFQKPSYRTSYEIKDRLKDPSSNLLVRTFQASSDTPVSDLKFFYQRTFSCLKKIEATYTEQNFLSVGSRKLLLEFDEVGGKRVIKFYHVEGIQKMYLSDTVKYSITGSITQ